MENDNEEYLTSDSLSDDNVHDDVVSADGEEADSDAATQPQEEALTLSEIEKELGKKFPDKATAMKALKDTFSYVGKKKEDVEKEVTPPMNSDELAELKREIFYTKNPELEELRDVIESMGSDPRKVVESEAFKKVQEAFKARSESENTKSIIHSNTRVDAGPSSDYAKDLAKAEQTGNWAEFLQKHKGIEAPKV